MALAKVTLKGHVTIPVKIRKMLGIKEGNKLLFIEDEGKVILINASTSDLLNVKRLFKTQRRN